MGSVGSSPRRPRRRTVLAAAAFAAVVGGGGALLAGVTGASPTRPAAATLNTVPVVTADLAQQDRFDATIGFDDPVVLSSPRTGYVTSVAAVGSVVVPGRSLLSIDDRPMVLLAGERPLVREIALGRDRVVVSAPAGGVITWVPEVGTPIGAGDVLYRVNEVPVIALPGDVPAFRSFETGMSDGADVEQLEAALVSMGDATPTQLTVDRRFTAATAQAVRRWQHRTGAPETGDVAVGSVVFLPGSVQVVETAATVGATAGGPVLRVSTGPATRGPDVLQLERSLVALGHDAGGRLVPDEVAGLETIDAVRSFQTAVGLLPTGVMRPGDVLVADAPLRIAEHRVEVGREVALGTPIVAVSEDRRVVRFVVPAARRGAVQAGRSVSVELPDRSVVPATVASVASTATGTGGQTGHAVRVVIDDAPAVARLDEASVRVRAVTGSVAQATAVPVAALVALREGGYGVERSRDGATPVLVAVSIGMISSDNLVQITAGDVRPGDAVVVP